MEERHVALLGAFEEHIRQVNAVKDTVSEERNPDEGEEGRQEVQR